MYNTYILTVYLLYINDFYVFFGVNTAFSGYVPLGHVSWGYTLDHFPMLDLDVTTKRGKLWEI